MGKQSKLRTIEQLKEEARIRSRLYRDRHGKDSEDRHTAESRDRNNEKRTLKRLGATNPRFFLAWDGEELPNIGPSIPGSYIFLMNSLAENNIVENDGKALTTQQCLDFICDTAKQHPEAINVVFGASYDMNMILKDLPYPHIQRLQKTGRVYWQNFSIEYVPRKYAIIKRYDPDAYMYKSERKPNTIVTLWDVINFFQGSFVKTLEEFFPVESERQELHLEDIKAGKKQRGDFSQESIDSFVKPYTRYEVLALVALMNRFNKFCREAGIKLKRYDGAGAAAAVLLDKYKVKRYYGRREVRPENADYHNDIKDHYDAGLIPWQVEDAAKVAFGGGRAELLKYGRTNKKVYHYDVISDYPSKLVKLPDQSQGTWSHSYNPEVNMLTDFSLYKIFYNFDRDKSCYPFFYRTEKGQVRYSHIGYGWVYGFELKVGLKYEKELGGTGIEIFEEWRFTPGNDVKPYAFVRDLFKKRATWKSQRIGAQLPMKLAINSIPGKMAQGKGWRGTIPPFYNLIYAGLITSAARAEMFDVMMQAPDQMIAVATDGLWSLVPLNVDVVDESDRDRDRGDDLGKFEFEELDGFTSVQAGIYFTKKNESQEIVYHYRGFNQGTISEQDVIDAWQERKYSIPVPTRRFVTMGTAIASREQFRFLWRVWDTSPRELEIRPNTTMKRSDIYTQPTSHAATQLIDTEIKAPTPMSLVECSFDLVDELHLSYPHVMPWDLAEKSEFQKKMEQSELEHWDIIESDV